MSQGRRRERIMRSVALLPNLITLANAFCGFYALAMVFDTFFNSVPPDVEQSALVRACQFIFLAMVFDALDGKVARWTKRTSDFGAELDSLCDVVSFGVAPAFIALAVVNTHMATMADPIYSRRIVFITCVFYMLCTLMRLARFNVEVGEEEEEHALFKGIPSPAAAGTMISLIYLYFDPEAGQFFAASQLQGAIIMALPWIAVMLGLLMISSIPYVHVVIRYLGGERSKFEHLVVAIVILMFVAYRPWLALASFCLLYVFSGLITWFWARRKVSSQASEKPL